MRRALGVAAALAVFGPASAELASAHGGRPILEARDRGYAVTVLAAPVTRDGVPALDLTTYLARQDLGEPDLGATVTLRVSDGRATRTLRPAVIGDGYEAIVPAAADAWRDWRIRVEVDGPAGLAVVEADPGRAYGGVAPGLVAGLAMLTAASAAAAVVVLRRRIRGAPAAAGPAAAGLHAADPAAAGPAAASPAAGGPAAGGPHAAGPTAAGPAPSSPVPEESP